MPAMLKRSWLLLGLIFVCFFVIGFISNAISPIIPEIITSFSLSLTMASLLPFAIYLAYGLISIPAGFLIERYREKNILVLAFILAFFSALLITAWTTYISAIITLFFFGSAMAIMQVTLHPVLRAAGGEEHFGFNLTIVQLMFGGASYLSPLVYSSLVKNLHRGNSLGPSLRLLESVTDPGHSWVSVFTITAFMVFITLLLLFFTRFPAVKLKEEEKIGGIDALKGLFMHPHVFLYALGIFLYVGFEVGLASWISQFLVTYHAFIPQTTGAQAVSWFWGLFTLGNLVTLPLLKLFDAKRILVSISGISIFCFCLGILGGKTTALLGLLGTSFFIAPMWPIIFSLGMNSVKMHHGAFSGILAASIIGGAVIPLAVGAVGDAAGLRTGMMLMVICLLYVAFIGFWAKPIVRNKRSLLKAGRNRKTDAV